MDENVQHTIAGLLRKREELLRENNDLRERMAVLTNDIDAIDRVLDTFGYQGELVGGTPRQWNAIAIVSSAYAPHMMAFLHRCQ